MELKKQELSILIASESVDRINELDAIFSSEYHILRAKDGEQALNALRINNSIVLIISDFHLPKLDGYSLLEHLREDVLLSDTPFVMSLDEDNVQGQIMSLDMTASGIITYPYNPNLVYHIVNNVLVRNIRSDNKLYEAFYRHIDSNSAFDEKSGLFGKKAFCSEVRRILDEMPDEKFVIFRMDLDGFKVLNDIYGVEAGDRYLSTISKSIRSEAIDIGVHGRWEADHFVSFMKLSDFNRLGVIELICGTKLFEDTGFELVHRLGIYVVDDPTIDVSLMCDRALLALKSIKGDYNKRYAMYDENMRIALLETQELINDMRSALANEEFLIYLQPQFNYSNDSLHGAEALVRWKHPTKGMIPPIKFIPIFEKNGFITDLDKYVWEQACKLLRKWKDQGIKTVPISVNVSRIDIYTVRLSEFFTNLINKYNLETDDIRIEITESAYIDNPASLIAAVEKLQNAGFSVEMDDFGSGASSLNTLKDVPVNMLKLDMKFIGKSNSDSEQVNNREGSILSSVVRMSNWLKLPVIAEGVETKTQADYLKSIGCVYMQGYYFAKPMPVEEFEELLRKSVKDFRHLKEEDELSNAYEFFNMSNKTNFMFNSFVGGAAIVEYNRKDIEIIRLNEKFLECLGYSRELNKKEFPSAEDLFSPEASIIISELLDKVIDSQKESDCQFTATCKGMEEWVHMRARLLAASNGKFIFYIATENVSHQMEMMMSNQQMAEQLCSIIECLPDGICEYEVTDEVVHMIYFNDKLPELFGYENGEFGDLYERRPYDGINPDDLFNFDQGLNDLQSGAKSMFTHKCRHMCKDGSWKWVTVNCSVIRKSDRATFCTAIIKEA